MPSTELRLSVRPLRLAMLIRAGELPDLERAAIICSSLWGGIQNPIIPIGELTDDAVDRLIREFRADITVAVAKTDAIAAVIERHRHLRWDAWPPDEPLVIDAGHGGTKAPQFRLFDMSAPARQYWWDEGRHSRIHGVLPTWARGADDSAMLAAMFGSFPPFGDDLPSLVGDYQRAVGAEKVDVESVDPGAEWVSRTTPITFTRYGLQLYRFRGLQESGLVVGNPQKVNDLVAFWNLRANGARVQFCPIEGPGRFMAFYRAFLTERGERRAEERENFLRLWVCQDLSEPDPLVRPSIEVSHSVRALAPEEAEFMVSPAAVAGAGGWPEHPMNARTETKSVLATIEERYGRQHISAQLSAPFPEGRAQSRRLMQKWMICLEPLSLTGATDWTLRIPDLPDLNEWYSEQMHAAHQNSIRVQSEGFDLITESFDDSLGLFPIREEDVIAKLMDRAGVRMSISTPGRLSQRIVGMVGGQPQTAVFRITGVRKLLSSKDVRRGVPFAQAVEIVRDKDPATGLASFDKFKRFWRETTPDGIIRTLITWEILRAGFRLKCPNCELRSVIDIDEVGQHVTCPLCTEEFLLGSRLTGREWVYRSSGVFAREGGPEGAIPGLLVGGELARGVGGFRDERTVLPAHDLIAGDTKCEVGPDRTRSVSS